MKGVPVRIELGPRDIENGQCVLVDRVHREKTFAPLDDLETVLQEKLQAVRDAMYEKALKNREAKTYRCKTIAEMQTALTEKGDGFIRAMWCGSPECEEKVKELTGAGSRCIPFDQETVSDTCVCCGKPARTMVLWGKAY